ncbi:terminase small subunit [Corynebacterium aurimucosum]
MSGVDENSLAASVARSVAARGDSVTPADQAVVDLALRYAHAIDKGVETGGQAATKALYLGPHLTKTLETLGCTPSGRGVKVADEPGPEDKAVKNEIAARRARLRGRGA